MRQAYKKKSSLANKTVATSMIEKGLKSSQVILRHWHWIVSNGLRYRELDEAQTLLAEIKAALG